MEGNASKQKNIAQKIFKEEKRREKGETGKKKKKNKKNDKTHWLPPPRD